jgi:hypothetical protein
MLQISASPTQVCGLLYPDEIDFTINRETYSLSAMMLQWFGSSNPLRIVKLPLVVILLMSLSPLVMPDFRMRIKAVVVTVVLCVFSYYLSFFVSCEYDYTTMLLILPVLLWLRQKESSAGLRWLLLASFLPLLLIFLPTPYALWPAGTQGSEYWELCTMQRVLPVVISFVLVTSYGVALAWRVIRSDQLLIRERIAAQLRGAMRPAAILGVLFLTVLTVALVTVPDRLLVTPSEWRTEDWIKHFEDILSRPGVSRRAGSELHRLLAIKYDKKDIKAAYKHFEKARQLAPENLALTIQEASFLAAHHEPAEAGKLVAHISPEQLPNKPMRDQLMEIRKKAAMAKPKK